jgi:multiple sugar transport system substrate-binding protein
MSLLLVLALALSACVAPAAQPAAPAESEAAAPAEEQIELRIAWWGSQSRHDRTIQVIEMFEELHPNIDIVYEFSAWDDYWTKVATQAAGGNLPDIMQQDYARIEEWNDRGLLLPLDDFVADGTLDFSNVSESELDGGRIDGKLYAINLGTNSQNIILDADAFAEAGIELPRQDWTWDEFEQIVMELHDKLGIWGMGPGLDDEQIWGAVYLGHGMWRYNPDGTALGYDESQDQLYVDHLNMILRLIEAEAVPNREVELAEYTNVGVEAQPIVTGEAAMVYVWSNQIVAIQTAAGEDRNFVPVELPRPEGGQSANYVKPSQFWSITTQSEHPQEAAMFIDYFTNSVEANEVLLAERGVPISSVVRDALKPLLGKSQLAMFDYLAYVVTDSSPIPPADPVGHADIRNNVFYPQVIDSVLLGQMTPEQGVKLLREEATAILAESAP